MPKLFSKMEDFLVPARRYIGTRTKDNETGLFCCIQNAGLW